MSIVKLPSSRDYWSSLIGIPDDVAESVNKFKQIKCFLHIVNNTTVNREYKLFKIRPIIDKLNEQLRKVPFEESLAVDEQLIPFKERHSIKQYNPKKPHK